MKPTKDYISFYDIEIVQLNDLGQYSCKIKVKHPNKVGDYTHSFNVQVAILVVTINIIIQIDSKY
jgi:hypothetical protein